MLMRKLRKLPKIARIVIPKTALVPTILSASLFSINRIALIRTDYYYDVFFALTFIFILGSLFFWNQQSYNLVLQVEKDEELISNSKSSFFYYGKNLMNVSLFLKENSKLLLKKSNIRKIAYCSIAMEMCFKSSILIALAVELL